MPCDALDVAPPHASPQFLVRYCFGAAYILALLHTGLGFGLDDSRLTWTNTVPHAPSGEQVPLNWVLGAAVVDAMNAAGRGSGGSGGGGGGGSARFWTHDEGSRAALKAGSTVLVLPLAALAVMALALALRLRGSASATAKGSASGRAHGVALQAATPGIALGSGAAGKGGGTRPSRYTGGVITPPGAAHLPGGWTSAMAPAGTAPTLVPDMPEAAAQEPGLGRLSISEARASFGDSSGPPGLDGAVVGFVSGRVSALRAQSGGGGGTTMRRNPSFITVVIGDGGSSAGQGAPHGGR